MTVNGKNYKMLVAIANVTMVMVKAGRETNRPLALMHGRSKAKLI